MIEDAKKDGISSGLTRWVVVADGEITCRCASIRTIISAVRSAGCFGCTANLLGVWPGDLGEVAPANELGHVWVRVAIAWEILELVVVPLLGNDSSDVRKSSALSNVDTSAISTGQARKTG